MSDSTPQFTQLAEKYDLPLYIYEGEVIINQANKLKKAFQEVKNVQFHYAVKANNNISILKLLKKQGLGLDTVSIQEVQLGLKAGFLPEQIIFTPNGVSFQEIKEAVQLKVKINIDNLSTLEHFGQEFPNYPVGIRMNPHILAGGNSKISVGHIDSKFGISIYQLPHIKRIEDVTKLNIEGIHMHTGSDILDVDVFLQGTEILLDVAKNFKNLDYIDLGSGFKVAYKAEDSETDIEYLGERLSERFNQFCTEYGKQLNLKFEPGKFLVSQSGTFVAKVNSIKQTTSTVFAAIDSGFNHLIRPMFYDSYHHIENISNPEGRSKYYSVVGYICETDTFATNRRISEIREEDILAFKNSGAYCFSMASNYNSRLKPAEVLIINNEDYLVRERDEFEDITRKMIEIPEENL